jgi:GH43 family beta-xylosidase
LGLLSIPTDGDFLDVEAWQKAGTPVLSYYSIDGVYGPGHNSFFRDYDGSVMIMYHGEVKLAAQDIRCTGMHRVQFDSNGIPAFNLSKERDLKPSLAEVELKVRIE